MNIKENIAEVRKKLNNEVIIAATKYINTNEMKELLSCGINNFGENRVDSFIKKYEELKDEKIVWHFIGHLQRNKVKLIANKIEYLHSLESLSLAEELNKHLKSELKCFVEVNISGDTTKYGIKPKNLHEFLKNLEKYDKIKIVGLMGMAKNTLDEEEIIKEFSLLKSLKSDLMVLSMGMSNDYLIAHRLGTDYVRLGRILYK